MWIPEVSITLTQSTQFLLLDFCFQILRFLNQFVFLEFTNVQRFKARCHIFPLTHIGYSVERYCQHRHNVIGIGEATDAGSI